MHRRGLDVTKYTLDYTYYYLFNTLTYYWIQNKLLSREQFARII